MQGNLSLHYECYSLGISIQHETSSSLTVISYTRNTGTCPFEVGVTNSAIL